jgi:hypothetical protein
MPTPSDWAKATSRAEALFGLHVNPYLNATAVTELAGNVISKIDVFASSAAGLVPELERAYHQMGIVAGQRGRLTTAKAGSQLVEELQRWAGAGNRVRLLETLAQAPLPGTEAAIARSLRQAEVVRESLRGFRWERLAPLREAAAEGADEHGQSGARIIATLRGALQADEIAQPLGQALSDTNDSIFDWLAAGQPTPPQPPRPLGPKPERPSASSGNRTRAKGTPSAVVMAELDQFLREHAEVDVVVEWRVAE